jgi:hypothetical protein
MPDITVVGGIQRAGIKFPGMDTSRIRLVSWGAGEMFELYYPLLDMKVEYGVCPWKANQGRTIHGVKIRDPQALLDEDPAKILVVIYAGDWPEILRQIAAIGPFKAIRAVSRSDTKTLLEQISALADAPAPAPRASNACSCAIVMQGPISEHWTRLALLWNRVHHPDAWLVLSTWERQDPALVDECRSLADETVISPTPDYLGFGNRNAQIRSARGGLEAVSRRRIPFSIKSRSDQMLTGRDIGSLFSYIAAAPGGERKRPHRMGVHFGTSWKHIPFQLSDQLLGGRTEDLLRMWSCPEDMRQHGEYHCEPESHFLSLRNVSNEAYVHERYAQGYGLPIRDLVDSYAFVRDHVLPLDAAVNLFQLKGIPLFDVYGEIPEETRRNENKVILSPGFEWWMMMQVNFAHAEAEARRVQESNFSVRDFWARKVG